MPRNRYTPDGVKKNMTDVPVEETLVALAEEAPVEEEAPKRSPRPAKADDSI